MIALLHLMAAALCAAFLCASSAVRANNPGVEKFKNYLPEQIGAMPDKDRQSSVPTMYVMAAQKALSVHASIAFARELNLLMYPGLGNYEAAVKMFQRDLGEPQTGRLTVSQVHALGVRAEYQQLGDVGFPTPYYSRQTADTASVAGTLKILDEKIAWPVNYLTLRCYRRDGYCERWMTSLSLPSETDWVRMYHVQEVDHEIYKISRWDNQTIEAAPVSSSSCRTSTLSLNFKTNEHFEITRNAGGDCEVMGVKMPKLGKPRISQIVEGKDIVQAEMAAIKRQAYSYLSSEFRARVEQALKPAQPKQ